MGKWRLDKTKLIETEVEVEDELNAYQSSFIFEHSSTSSDLDKCVI